MNNKNSTLSSLRKTKSRRLFLFEKQKFDSPFRQNSKWNAWFSRDAPFSSAVKRKQKRCPLSHAPYVCFHYYRSSSPLSKKKPACFNAAWRLVTETCIDNKHFSFQLSLHQLNCLYFKTQRTNKSHNCYRHLKYTFNWCNVVPPLVTMCSTTLTLHCCHPMSVTQLLLCLDLPLAVRRCQVSPLLPIHCPWFVVWNHRFHRSVSSIDRKTRPCATGT